MTNYDKERLKLLMNTNISLLFGGPQSVQEMDALDHFNALLLPEERTELLGKMHAEYMALLSSGSDAPKCAVKERIVRRKE